MNCIVTAGPTYEPLDEARRLTNFSTGKLGTLLANFLVERGHQVTLLIGSSATVREKSFAQKIETFTTSDDLLVRLRNLSGENFDAIFHAAAVSDFKFGRVFSRHDSGELCEINSGKFSTREGNLLAELVPTAKIISSLRTQFPRAKVVGWKYEVEGHRDDVLQKAAAQILENKTDACVANGPAYGLGFGLVEGNDESAHFARREDLFLALEKLIGVEKSSLPN
ncbi:MAG: DNA/pantothenate metabolism flavoprotein domain protein [Verrucomicrobiota bacterium]|nr:DNA/pantothenate metabolism flavoprotein domain protein [Verrucomicrobiota bacterium]